MNVILTQLYNVTNFIKKRYIFYMKKLSAVIFAFLIVFTTAVSAHEKENKNKDEETEINKEVGNSDINKNKTQIKIKDEDNDDEDEKTNKKEFHIKGVISAFDTTSITVGGQAIKIDSKITKEFKQRGNIAVGMYAKIEGIINNGTYYAKEIVVNNRNKKDITPTPSSSISVTPSASPTITPTGTITATPTGTATPTITGVQSAQAQQVIALDIIKEALEKILNVLKGMKI
ncbi:hypothetical protein C4559_05185 [Candidatus Microgenomates bacterium]|nr:MAG: hypothetical protein C4559_05185 [Candidatus Microgenomates bacterium]